MDQQDPFVVLKHENEDFILQTDKLFLTGITESLTEKKKFNSKLSLVIIM